MHPEVISSELSLGTGYKAKQNGSSSSLGSLLNESHGYCQWEAKAPGSQKWKLMKMVKYVYMYWSISIAHNAS